MNRYLTSPLVKAGIGLFLVGCGPLLAIIAAARLGLTSDPNPNPIGPGLLAFVTFWPSVILSGIGVVRVMRQNAAAARHTRRVLMIPIEDSEPVATSLAASLVQSPVVRAAAAGLGLLLIGNGVSTLGDGGRGPASALIIGAVFVIFAVTGRIPTWFRR